MSIDEVADYLEYENIIRGRRGIGRIYRERYDPMLELSEDAVRAQYRLTPDLIEDLTMRLTPFLERPTRHSGAMTPAQITMIGLKYLATGDSFSTLHDLFRVGFGTISRSVEEFVDAVYELRNDYIRFPQTPQELARSASKFSNLAGFRNVIGCVDGTLLPICRLPSETEAIYVCRKGYHAINVQVVCDADLIIRNIVANYPGSTHDAYIWNHCQLQEAFEVVF